MAIPGKRFVDKATKTFTTAIDQLKNGLAEMDRQHRINDDIIDAATSQNMEIEVEYTRASKLIAKLEELVG